MHSDSEPIPRFRAELRLIAVLAVVVMACLCAVAAGYGANLLLG